MGRIGLHRTAADEAQIERIRLPAGRPCFVGDQDLPFDEAVFKDRGDMLDHGRAVSEPDRPPFSADQAVAHEDAAGIREGIDLSSLVPHSVVHVEGIGFFGLGIRNVVLEDAVLKCELHAIVEAGAENGVEAQPGVIFLTADEADVFVVLD